MLHIQKQLKWLFAVILELQVNGTLWVLSMLVQMVINTSPDQMHLGDRCTQPCLAFTGLQSCWRCVTDQLLWALIWANCQKVLKSLMLVLHFPWEYYLNLFWTAENTKDEYKKSGKCHCSLTLGRIQDNWVLYLRKEEIYDIHRLTNMTLLRCQFLQIDLQIQCKKKSFSLKTIY